MMRVVNWLQLTWTAVAFLRRLPSPLGVRRIPREGISSCP